MHYDRQKDSTSPRLKQLRRIVRIGVLVATLYVAWQGLVIGHAEYVVHTNIRTLAVENNLRGRAAYRRELIQICAVNGVKLTDEEVDIQLDEKAGEIVISVPFRWQLNLIVAAISGRRTLTVRVARWPDGAW